MLIDTHSHIYEREFDDDRDAVVERAVEAGVGLMLMPAIDAESDERMMATHTKYAVQTRVMMGLHPTSMNDNPQWRKDVERVREALDNPSSGVKFCAVGEIGLDFYWSKDFIKEQVEAFETQVRWAAERQLPVVIHTRAAWEQMEQSVARLRSLGISGVFHAFSEDVACYERLREMGDFVFGIGGVVTFKKSKVAETVKQMSLDDIILETDCPYLTPVPHRGERNESSYVRFVCEKVAELKGVSIEEVAERTAANARRIFRI